MDDDYIYTVGMPGIKIKRRNILRAFFIKRGNEALKNSIICGDPTNLYRVF